MDSRPPFVPDWQCGGDKACGCAERGRPLGIVWRVRRLLHGNRLRRLPALLPPPYNSSRPWFAPRPSSPTAAAVRAAHRSRIARNCAHPSAARLRRFLSRSCTTLRRCSISSSRFAIAASVPTGPIASPYASRPTSSLPGRSAERDEWDPLRSGRGLPVCMTRPHPGERRPLCAYWRRLEVS